MNEVGGKADLSDAIQALRDSLVKAMWDGQQSGLRFRVDPVELTVQVGVTREGSGAAGVSWHILTLGGKRSRRSETVQTLKLRLTPLLVDEKGEVVSGSEVLIAGAAEVGSGSEQLALGTP